MSEPVMEGVDGEVRNADEIWDLFTTSLFEHRDGSDELLRLMAELGIGDIAEQKRFVAMATEMEYLAHISMGMTVNVVQLFHLAQKWGVPLKTMKRMKTLLAPDAPEPMLLSRLGES